MTITRTDLKIFKPELLGSSDDAGGQRTKNEVVSGQLNELFPAISDIDHAQGAVDIVKCYPTLYTTDTSTLLDGHVFLSMKPTDPMVNILLVESASMTDAAKRPEMVDMLTVSSTYHGVTKNTEIASGFEVSVEDTSNQLLPTLTKPVAYPGNQPFGSQSITEAAFNV